jgi:hypothetical protein
MNRVGTIVAIPDSSAARNWYERAAQLGCWSDGQLGTSPVRHRHGRRRVLEQGTTRCGTTDVGSRGAARGQRSPRRARGLTDEHACGRAMCLHLETLSNRVTRGAQPASLHKSRRYRLSHLDPDCSGGACDASIDTCRPPLLPRSPAAGLVPRRSSWPPATAAAPGIRPTKYCCRWLVAACSPGRSDGRDSSPRCAALSW